MEEMLPGPEKDPMFEAIAAILRADPQSAEGRSLLSEWSRKQGDAAMQENTPRANTEATLRHAKLYLASGLADSARAHFEDAAYEAEQGGYGDILEEARAALELLARS